MPHGSSFWLAIAALLGSLISLCVGASYAKALFPALGAEGATAMRVAVATVVLVALWRPWRWALRWRDARLVALYGVVLGVMNLLFYLAIARLPVGVAIAIEFTGPLAVAVAGSRRVADFVWIGLAVVGLGLLLPLAPNASALDPLGVAYALGAAVCWALYILVGKRAGHLPGGQVTAWGMLTALLIVGPVGVARAGWALFDPAWLPVGIAVGVLSSAVPYSLEMVALKRLPSQTFGILLSLEPAIGAIAAWAILGERLTAIQGLAIALVIVASVGSTMGVRDRTPLAASVNAP